MRSGARNGCGRRRGAPRDRPASRARVSLPGGGCCSLPGPPHRSGPAATKSVCSARSSRTPGRRRKAAGSRRPGPLPHGRARAGGGPQAEGRAAPPLPWRGPAVDRVDAVPALGDGHRDDVRRRCRHRLDDGVGVVRGVQADDQGSDDLRLEPSGPVLAHHGVEPVLGAQQVRHRHARSLHPRTRSVTSLSARVHLASRSRHLAGQRRPGARGCPTAGRPSRAAGADVRGGGTPRWGRARRGTAWRSALTTVLRGGASGPGRACRPGPVRVGCAARADGVVQVERGYDPRVHRRLRG